MWVKIPGFEDYEINEDGDIRSYLWGNGSNLKEPRPIKLQLSKKNYFVINLSKNGKKYKQQVHRLVLLSFRGPPPPGKPSAAHLDGNRKNSKLSNLIWASHKENISHKKLHGTYRCGDDLPWSKLTSAQVLEIRARFKAGEGRLSLTKAFGIDRAQIHRITTREAWKHL